MKKLLNALGVYTLLIVVVPFLILEGPFRLLPVADPPYLLPVNATNPVARFEPNRDYVYGSNWNFAIRSHKHSNNYGFNHYADYDPGAKTPLLAVIGDSFVEAHEVDVGKSAAELLHAGLHGGGRVYSFGISGAPLSTYLAYADWARLNFRPSAMAVVVVANDFDESLLKYKDEPRLYYFNDSGLLVRVDYQISPLKKLMRQSAFLRYLQHHMLLSHRLAALERRLTGEVGPDYEQTMAKRMPDMKRAVDYFLAQLPERSGLAPTKIALVLDADRPAIYSEATLAPAQNGYHEQMRRYIGAEARRRGFEVIDLEPVFIARYQREGKRFEFPTDSHWNEFGQRVVAAELERSSVFKQVFGAAAVTTATAAER
jgi:SGNH hydrolase-like domain, acetyltransferase AlgX